MNPAFKQLDFDKTQLSLRELDLLEKLVEAVRLAGSIYDLQENNDFPGANFYPHDASKEELEEVAKKDPLILDPYTVVERGAGGQLVAVPYYQKYSSEVQKIAALLEEAASLSDEPNFAKFLQARVQSFLDDSWDASEIEWLRVGESKFDLLIGPIEPYLDNLFSVKCAFQGSVRVRSKEMRFNPQNYLRVIQSLHVTSPLFFGGTKRKQPVQVRVDDVVALGGWHARLCPVGTNLPNDPQKVAKYGTKIIIYTNDIRLREGSITIPVLEKIFVPRVLKGRTRDDLLDGAVRATMLHEITEAVVKYPDAVKRLGSMYTPVKELHASIVGAKSCTFHVLKGVLTQKDYEAILMIFVSRLFETWLRSRTNRGIESYFKGYLVAFNFFVEYDGLKVKNGVIDPDFEKLFVSVEGLSSVLAHLMCSGTEEQARRFFDQYSSTALLERFTPKVKDIPIDF